MLFMHSGHFFVKKRLQIQSVYVIVNTSADDTTLPDIIRRGFSLKINEQQPLTEAVYYLLLAFEKPLHGYGAMQYVEEISGNRVKLGPGTLYGAIKTLVEKAWIELIPATKDTRKKEYVLTEIGNDIVEAEIKRLEELVMNGKKIMRGEQP